MPDHCPINGPSVRRLIQEPLLSLWPPDERHLTNAWPDCSVFMPGTLILVPTAGELKVLSSRLELPEDSQIHLCGFGPVASAVRTTQLIAGLQPERIILAGIAGALSREIAPGKAALFQEVAMYGIGAGSENNFRTAQELGWLHWNYRNEDGKEVHFGDQIPLADHHDRRAHGNVLLTVCSAAATLKEVYDRRQKFPQAIAEDMEGFSVALAGAMAGVPVQIIRGISNIAGDRDKARWRIQDALISVADILREQLS